MRECKSCLASYFQTWWCHKVLVIDTKLSNIIQLKAWLVLNEHKINNSKKRRNIIKIDEQRKYCSHIDGNKDPDKLKVSIRWLAHGISFDLALKANSSWNSSEKDTHQSQWHMANEGFLGCILWLQYFLINKILNFLCFNGQR